MEDGTLTHSAALTKLWYTKHSVNLFGGQPGNSRDLNAIKLPKSQMKQLQSKKHTTLATGLKRIVFSSLEEDLANLPQISLQKHAEAYDSGC